MSTPDDVTRAEGMAEARARARSDRGQLLRNLPRAHALAQSRARNGRLGWAFVRGAPRAIRHDPAVAEVLWDFADAVQREAESHMTESPASTESHFRTDGNTSRENNPRGSYRTSVRTYTHAAVRAEHDDHTLERAFSTVKSRGVR